jgi:hypothetical protein
MVSPCKPPASSLLELASAFPEIAQMACPPERALMLLHTNKTFGASKFLRATLRARPTHVYKLGTRCEEWPGFLHGMGLAEALTPLLAKLVGVTTLDLSCTGLGEHGARVLAYFIRQMKIENLVLDENNLGNSYPAEKILENRDIRNVATEFPKVLAFLSVHETRRPESGIAALVDALLANETVKYVSLELNAIRGQDWWHLLRLARESRTLQVLKVGYNNDNDYPASLFSELVTSVSQSTLQVLSLAAWELDETTAIAIIRSLRTNKTLQVLDLSGVCFNESDLIGALKHTLAENTTLTTLHIYYVKGSDNSASLARVERSMLRPFTLTLGPYFSRP